MNIKGSFDESGEWSRILGSLGARWDVVDRDPDAVHRARPVVCELGVSRRQAAFDLRDQTRRMGRHHAQAG